MTLTVETKDLERWIPTKESDRQAVMVQLGSILESAHFRASKRYPSFLRFIVERELDGRGGELKERTIGIGVFGKDAAYDTNADPIVRVTAAEVRKRLGQYYSESVHCNELRISLSSGSYTPYFLRSTKKTPEPDPIAVVTSTDKPFVAEKSVSHANLGKTPGFAFTRSRPWFWIGCIALALTIVFVGATRHAWWRKSTPAPTDNALTAFWKPFAVEHETVLVSMGTLSMLHPASAPSEPTPDMGILEAIQHYNIVGLPDAIALSRISGVLGDKRVTLHIVNAETTSFEDVQAGPTILIGAFSNQSTMRLTSRMRFYFEDSKTVSRILDREAKTQPGWNLYRAKTYSSLVQDYAIIARYHDSTTGRIIVIAGGIGPNGTQAAGDFLTCNACLERLMERAPKNGSHENVEAVIATQVIDGKSGPPQVVASQFW